MTCRFEWRHGVCHAGGGNDGELTEGDGGRCHEESALKSSPVGVL